MADKTVSAECPHLLGLQKILQVELGECWRRGPSCAGVDLSLALPFEVGQVCLFLSDSVHLPVYAGENVVYFTPS